MTPIAPAVALPSPRDEAWRYTPVDHIVTRLEAAAPASGRGVDVDRALVDALAGSHGGPRLVTVNGGVDAELSDIGDVRPGMWVGRIADAPASAVAPSAGPRDDGFQALNRAAATDGAVIVVGAGVDTREPLHIVHLAAPGDGPIVNHPRTIIVAGRDSHVAIIETYCGTTGPVVTNAATTVYAEPGAAVHHVRIQAEAPGAVHVGHTRVDEEQGADVRVVSVMIGADVARHAVDVGLRGPGARTFVDGLALPARHQRHDHVVTVDHAASACTSRQRVKSVVDDHARSSFSGHVIVRAGTLATDADQSSRSLLLAPTAQADARPWLEILADDVRCTHGATVGRLDDDALFYLRSRGISLAEGRHMLVGAFVREVIDAIPHPSLREHLGALVAAHSTPAPDQWAGTR